MEEKMKIELTEKEVKELQKLQEYFEELAAQEDIGIDYAPHEEPEREFLIQAKGEDYKYSKVVSENELIHYIDMQDYCPEEYQIYEVTNMGQISQIWYVGWQPNCLIQFSDSVGNIVLEGYGTDH